MSYSEHRSRRLVLRSPYGEGAVARYADANAWPKVREQPEDVEAGTMREVVWRIAPGIDLHYSEDDATGARYVFVSASERNLSQSFSAHAEQNLDIIPFQEFVEDYDAASGSEARADALLRLALAGPQEFDEKIFSRISGVLRDPDPEMRKAAIYATSYSPSRHYRPLLRELARRDPVRQLRKEAKDMIAAYDEVGIGEP